MGGYAGLRSDRVSLVESQVHVGEQTPIDRVPEGLDHLVAHLGIVCSQISKHVGGPVYRVSFRTALGDAALDFVLTGLEIPLQEFVFSY